MSDLIERLRERSDEMEFATNLEAEAAAQLEAQQAEIARLRALVEHAYHEGFKDGDFFSGRGTWKTSNSRTTLEIKP